MKSHKIPTIYSFYHRSTNSKELRVVQGAKLSFFSSLFHLVRAWLTVHQGEAQWEHGRACYGMAWQGVTPSCSTTIMMVIMAEQASKGWKKDIDGLVLPKESSFALARIMACRTTSVLYRPPTTNWSLGDNEASLSLSLSSLSPSLFNLRSLSLSQGVISTFAQ